MDLTATFQNFLNSIGGMLPGVLGALLVLIIGWFIASSLGKLAGRLVYNSGLEKRLGTSISKQKLAEPVHKLVYYLLLIVVLMVVLEMLGVENVLQPLKDMVAKFTGYLPNVVGAGVIAFIGYTLASMLSELVGVGSNAIENFSLRMGLHTKFDLTKILRQLAFIVIFIPILISALDTLQISAISDPAKAMLSQLMDAIPNILAAGVVLLVAIVGGRYVKEILGSLLHNLKADELPEAMNLTSVVGSDLKLSNLLANTAYFFICFFGIIAAMNKLGFTKISNLLSDLLGVSGHIFFGAIILVIGNAIASFVYRLVNNSQSGSFVANIARFATLGLFLAIALRSMGIANEIVELAFGLILGALAVAFALAFGLGGREAAGKQMDHFFTKLRNDK